MLWPLSRVGSCSGAPPVGGAACRRSFIARTHVVVRVSVAVLAAVAVVTSAPCTRAEANAPVRVVFVFEREADPLLTRIETEVAAVGFTVVERAGDRPLEELARTERASAAVRVLPNGSGVEVWMADATSGRSLLRQVIVDERPGGPDEALIALQTSELLRTSLLSKSEETAPPPQHAPPQSPAVRPAAPGPEESAAQEGPRAALHLGPGALYSPGGAGPALQLWVSLQRSLSEHLGLGLDLSVPLIASALKAQAGKAEIGVYSAGVGLFAGTAPTGAFFASGGLGVALARLVFAGQAEAPLQSSSPSVWTGAGTIRAEAGVEPASWLRVGLSGVAGATFERVHVEFAGSPAGDWGRGFVGAYAFVGVPWR